MRKRLKDDRRSPAKIADIVRPLIPQGAGDDEVLELCKMICKEQMPKGVGEPSISEFQKLVRMVFCTLRCELEILHDIASDAEVTDVKTGIRIQYSVEIPLKQGIEPP